MPGGGGGSKPTPPKMRFRRERRSGTVVYADASPKSPFWLWSRAAVQFIAGSFFLGLPFFLIGSMFLPFVGQSKELPLWLAVFAWTLGTAIAFRMILLGPARFELEPSAGRKALVFRRVYLLGPPGEQEYRAPKVEAAALLGRDRSGPYLQLKLLLSDGSTQMVDEGEEKDRMEELARDTSGALGVPLVRAAGVRAAWPLGACLTSLALPSGGNRRVDFDYDSRLMAAWGLCLGAFPLALIFLYGAVRIAMDAWTAPVSKNASPLAGFLFCAVLGVVFLLTFLVLVRRLSRDRYLALRLARGESRVAFQRRTWLGKKREDAVTADEIAGVLVFCNRKNQVRQVWLEPKAGRRVFVDEGGKAEELERLAKELAQCLHAPVRRERQSWFRLSRGAVSQGITPRSSP